MKARKLLRYLAQLPVVAAFLLISPSVQAQGRVLINEYLAWPGTSCGTTAEFVELLNFGPGPVDIGCWVITDGDYAITIPSPTVLMPGDHYVLAGREVIMMGCANLARTITADLNWNRGGITSAPIPTTGDGFMTDGGGAGEQLVLFNANREIVDAIARNPEPSSTITTAAVPGCTPWTFDLDDMNVRYEIIGEAQGRNNSYSRRIDGGCGWLKDPHQSAGDKNNTPGNVPLFTAGLSVVQPLSCEVKGYAVVHILEANYSQVFPMRYLLARDTDSSGTFDNADHYVYATDTTSPNIELGELESGVYRVVVETNNGCDLQALDFNILDCNSALLSVPIRSFRLSRNGSASTLHWELNSELRFSKLQLQVSKNGGPFENLYQTTSFANLYQGIYSDAEASTGNAYRIIVTDIAGERHQSAVLRLGIGGIDNKESFRVYTNKNGNIQTEAYSSIQTPTIIRIIDPLGKVVLQKNTAMQRGINLITINSGSLIGGVYIMQLAEKVTGRTRTVKFYYNRY